MGRCRRAILCAAAGGLAAATATAAVLNSQPALAECIRGGRIPGPWGQVGIGILLIVLLAAIPAALPRAIRKAAALSLLGIVLSGAGLLAVCPSFVNAAWSVPELYPALNWLVDGDDYGYDTIRQVAYENGALLARTWQGQESAWNVEDGTFLRTRRVDPGPSSAPPARPLPVQALRGGTPIRVFESPGRYAETSRKGPPKTVWTTAPRTGMPHRPGGGPVTSRRAARDIWSTDDGRKVLSFPDASEAAFSSDGRLLFTTVPFELPVPMPGVPWEATIKFQALWRVGVLHDLDEGRVLWKLLLPHHPGHDGARFSPSGRYLWTEPFMIDVRAGRVIGQFKGSLKAWLEGASCALMGRSREALVFRLPGFEQASSSINLQFDRFALRPDGRELAAWNDHEIRVFSFPGLEEVHTHRMLMRPRLHEFSGAAGVGAAVLFGLIGLLLPQIPRPVSCTARPDSPAARRFLLSYVFFIPAATACAPFLPVDLNDGAAFLSFLASGGLLLFVAWHASGVLGVRLGLSVLALGLPFLALVFSLERASKPLCLLDLPSARLVNDRWINSGDRIVELSTGKEIARLGVEFHSFPHFDLEGSVLRAWTMQCMFEWSIADWTLVRAERRGAWRWEDPGVPSERNWLPIEPSWRMDRYLSRQHLRDGRIVYVRDVNGKKWLMVSEIGRIRFLEIPLHAALGALLVLLGRAWLSRGRGYPGAGPAEASPASA